MLRSISWTNSSTTMPRLSNGEGSSGGLADARPSSASGIGDPEEDLLRLAVLLDAHPAVARLLVAVARRLEDTRREPGVDVDLARPQRSRYPPGAVEVAREHARGQAVRGVVGDREGLGLGLEGQ